MAVDPVPSAGHGQSAGADPKLIATPACSQQQQQHEYFDRSDVVPNTPVLVRYASTTTRSLLGHCAVPRRPSSASVCSTTASGRRSRPPSASTAHRGLAVTSIASWTFLTSTAAAADAESKLMEVQTHVRIQREQHQQLLHRPTRPATAREKSSEPGNETTKGVPLPRRPATCRGHVRVPMATQQRVVATPGKVDNNKQAATTPSEANRSDKRAGPRPKSATQLIANLQNARVCDPRVFQEVRQHEVDEEVYVDPLVGKSVELQSSDIIQRPSSSIKNAVGLQDFHRVKAFQARSNGRYSAVIAHYHQLLALAPCDTVAWFQLATAYDKTGNYEAALDTYKRVVALDGRDPFLYYNMGNVQMKMGHVRDAIAAYTTAIHKSNPPRPLFFKQRGAAFRQVGEFEQAACDYTRFLTCKRQQWRQHKQGGSLRSVMSTMSSNVGDTLEAPTIHDNDSATTSSFPSKISNEGTYHSDPLYPAPKTFAARIDATTSPLEAANHARAVAVACAPRHARSHDDVLFLMDFLRQYFAVCARLRPEACEYVAQHILGAKGVAKDIALFYEGERGRNVFFIGTGQVLIYKKMSEVGRPVAAATDDRDNADDGEAESDDPAALSWEMMTIEPCRSPVGNESPRDDGEMVLPSPTTAASTQVTTDWKAQQIELCELSQPSGFGFQGMATGGKRLYSAVVAEDCDLFVLSWEHLREAERIDSTLKQGTISRFLGTLPLFTKLPASELYELALKAKSTKIVGSKVICCEGQQVDGLIIVREGQVYELNPSGLPPPRDFSITFKLSGTVVIKARGAHDHTGRQFFTQLEHIDDPLAFVHVNDVVHGFLSPTYLSKTLAKFVKLGPTRLKPTPAQAATLPTAALLTRGHGFCAATSWIPPRKSRATSTIKTDVSFAKAALVTSETTEVLFFTSSDLTTALSLTSRDQLQQNLTELGAIIMGTTPSHVETKAKLASYSKVAEQLVREARWKKYKKDLVAAIVDDKQRRRRPAGVHLRGGGQ